MNSFSNWELGNGSFVYFYQIRNPNLSTSNYFLGRVLREVAIGLAPLSPLRPPMDGAESKSKQSISSDHSYGLGGLGRVTGQLPVCPLEAIELTEPLLIDTDECCE